MSAISRFIYKICNEDDNGAIPLYEGLDKKSSICNYVLKIPRPSDLVCRGKYALRQTGESGAGYTYGTAGNNIDTSVKELPIEEERIILDRDEHTVIGYAYKGEYDYYCNGDRISYIREIFLPINNGDKKTESSYSYTVYPADGTSSEFSKSRFTGFVIK